ncbi:MAG: hypothetical protein ACREYE_09105 [Gammaproteobacteria bacterium]
MLKRKPSGYVCLLIYLIVGAGNALAPLLFMILGHAHKTYVNYSDQGMRLTLHHPGHPDQHEPKPFLPSPHQPDVLDQVLAAITGQEDQEDHVIQIPAQKPQAMAAFKTIEISNALSLPVTTYPFSSFVELASVHLRARPPPGINPTLASRRTTVLLI